MDRRQFLAAIGAAGVAGCTGGDPGGGSSPSPSRSATPSPTPEATPILTPTATSTAIETETETESPTATAQPASFVLDEWITPSSIELGEAFQLSFRVTNTGGRVGDFQTDVTVADAATGDTTTAGPLSARLDPGETTTIDTGEIPVPYLTTLTITLEALDRSHEVDVVPKRLAFGETHTFADIVFGITGIEFQDRLEADADPQTSYIVPAEGNKIALVTVTAENTSGGVANLPVRRNFDLVYGDRQADALIEERVSGYYYGGRVQAGVSRSGWLMFEVPAETNKSDVEVVWSQSSENVSRVVYWVP